jgi:hypothetical protein
MTHDLAHHTNMSSSFPIVVTTLPSLVRTNTYFLTFNMYACTGVRLRKASLVRNHHTPLDFVTDRYRSQLLRYTIFTIQVLASFVYLSAQVTSLQSTFNIMFGFDPSADVWPVIVIMLIILGKDHWIQVKYTHFTRDPADLSSTFMSCSSCLIP